MKKDIEIVDQTIREGMQHKGIVFTRYQREKIVAFQERLNIDVCQAGYPPAHEFEAATVGSLHRMCLEKGFRIRIGAMGRAIPADARILIQTGIKDFHLHMRKNRNKAQETRAFSQLSAAVELIRRHRPDAEISVAVLDIFKTETAHLERTVECLAKNTGIDIISLPDTSGVAPPNMVFDKIKALLPMAKQFGTKISVHCHNDMGMANANGLMGIHAGAEVLEASVAGIGERNGISDLFVTTEMLRNQGVKCGIKTEDFPLFQRYYDYVNSIYKAQTGVDLIDDNTPAFGGNVKTHVAGTHAESGFGVFGNDRYYLNLLCGRHLVEKYLNLHALAYNKKRLNYITEEIKSKSVQLGRRLYKNEIKKIAENSLQKEP